MESNNRDINANHLDTMSDREENMTAVAHRNKFFATTSMVGFGLIQASNSRLEIIFWYITIVIFVCLTVINISNISYEYYSQETVTKVHISKLAHHHNLTNFEIRIHFSPIDAQHYSFEGQMRNLDTKMKFLNSSWSYPVLLEMIHYAKLMSTCEIHNERCTTADTISMVMQEILNQSQRLNITDLQLMQKVGDQLLQWFQFRIQDPLEDFLAGHPSSLWKSRLLNIQPSKNGHGSLRASFSFKRLLPLSVEGAKQQLVFQVSLSKSTDYILQGKEDSYDKAKDLLKAAGHSLIVIYGQQDLATPTGQTNQATIWKTNVIFSHHSIKDCINSRFTWSSDCLWRNITTRCRCKPLFVASTEADDQFESCKIHHYSSCFNDSKLGNLRMHCYQRSPAECDRDFYETMASKDSEKNARDNRKCNLMQLLQFIDNAISVTLTLLNSERPVFQDQFAKTLPTFVAELGNGNDFWLGCSVISGMHLVLYIIKQIIYSCKSNTKTGKNVRQLVSKFTQSEPMGRFVKSVTEVQIQQADARVVEL